MPMPPGLQAALQRRIAGGGGGNNGGMMPPGPRGGKKKLSPQSGKHAGSMLKGKPGKSGTAAKMPPWGGQ